MLHLQGKTLLLGGFHDHWWRADADNPSLLLAALDYYHYDFVTLMCGPEYDGVSIRAANAYCNRLKIYHGREEMFGWGHVITVNPRAPKLDCADDDYRGILRQLKKTNDLVILAHPTFPVTHERLLKTGEVDRLLDEGDLDGVELINGAGFETAGHDELITWYERRVAAGKKTPIVAGWDVHALLPIDLPVVLYTADRPPIGHLDSAGRNRTILFEEENSLAAIVAAVKAGRTVIEDLRTGELVGPPELVSFLKAAGYREAIADLDAKRDAVRIDINAPWVAGRSGNLKVSHAGTLRLPITFELSREHTVNGPAHIAVEAIPALQQKDVSHLPIAWRGADGFERLWAVELRHPIQLEVLPNLTADETSVEVIAKQPFRGILELQIGTEKIGPIRSLDTKTVIPLGLGLPANIPVAYELTARSDEGERRVDRGFLTFAGATRFSGDWSEVPEVGIDQACFVPRMSYGASVWPSPQGFSAKIQFAWNDRALLFRAQVRDSIHYQPFRGHYVYQADCVQLAIDPMMRRQETTGNVYCFNLALTNVGPEVYRWLSPTQESSAPPPETSLSSQYLKLERCEGGLIYSLKLPWSELSPVQPHRNARLGVYVVLFNNNGSGHLDALHWPVPIDGVWTKPNRWGVLSLK